MRRVIVFLSCRMPRSACRRTSRSRPGRARRGGDQSARRCPRAGSSRRSGPSPRRTFLRPRRPSTWKLRGSGPAVRSGRGTASRRQRGARRRVCAEATPSGIGYFPSRAAEVRSGGARRAARGAWPHHRASCNGSLTRRLGSAMRGVTPFFPCSRSAIRASVRECHPEPNSSYTLLEDDSMRGAYSRWRMASPIRATRSPRATAACRDARGSPAPTRARRRRSRCRAPGRCRRTRSRRGSRGRAPCR